MNSPNHTDMHTPRRFIVVGTSGSGKTTTARAISSRLGIPHIELDSLYHQPGWTHDTDEMFRAKVAQAISGESWVVDGNYSIVHDIVLPRAQVIVWLDHPFWRVMTQLVTRTARRMRSREELWNGNKEELTKMFERDNLFSWAIHRHNMYRGKYRRMASRSGLSHHTFVRIRSTEELEKWLDSL